MADFGTYPADAILKIVPMPARLKKAKAISR
jgi:hypothetical protein